MPTRIDFKQIAQDVDVQAVAELLGLKFGKDLRARCPTCDSDRAIQLFPETNTYYCHSIQGKDSDVIALFAHIKHVGMYAAAKILQEQLTAPTMAPTRKSEGKKQLPPAPKAAFDPIKFEASLAYTDEVAALGITEEQAEAFGIGFKRGKLYIPIRYPSGTIAGWQYTENGVAHFPKEFLADAAPNVVRFTKRA